MYDSIWRYVTLIRRWLWLIILGVVLCSSVTYVVSKHLPPVYQASATLALTIDSAATTYESIVDSELAIPTYAQMVTTPAILEPVVAEHPGMTLEQLQAMISVNPESNTQILEVSVKNRNARLATQLADQIAHSLVDYTSAAFSDSALSTEIQIIPAAVPTVPISPKPLPDAELGAIVGLGLALALIVLFEWIDDLPFSLEEVQSLLKADILTVIPRFSRRKRHNSEKLEELPELVRGNRELSAFLHAAQVQGSSKLIAITSSLVGEGKSTLAISLASYLALTGKSILLVDANPHHPTVTQEVATDAEQESVRTILEFEAQPAEDWDGQTTRATQIPSLHVLTAENFSVQRLERLEPSQRDLLFAYFQQGPFDLVIFDTPALFAAPDAQVLSSYMKNFLLVVDPTKTSRRVLRRAEGALRHTNGIVQGIVINKSTWRGQSNTHQPSLPTRQSSVNRSTPSDTSSHEEGEKSTTSSGNNLTGSENTALPL